MHGRPRNAAPLTDEQKKARALKIAKYNKLKTIVLIKHKQNEFTQETKLITGKLIELNPDFYTLWNFRRNIVNHFRAEITQTEKNDTKSSSDVINGNDEDSSETNNIDSNDDAKSDSCSRKYNDKNDKDENDNNDTDTDKPLAAEQENKQRDSLTVLFAGELRLTEAALRKNPKSYYAWHHRKWVVDQGYNSIDDELLLCDKMLSLDSRNFHCWNYRRYVFSLVPNKDYQKEFNFTTTKINENFSNYSAWHYRTVLLPCIFDVHNQTPTPAQTSPLPSSPSSSSLSPPLSLSEELDRYDSLLDKEFAFVKQAFYVEPEDQSAWLYHRWLLGKILVLPSSSATNLSSSLSSPPSSSAETNINVSFPSLAISLGTPMATHTSSSSSCPHSTSPSSTYNSAPETDASYAFDTPSKTHSPYTRCNAQDGTLQRLMTRQVSVLQREIKVCRELAQVEPNCKWVILTLAVLLGAVEAMNDNNKDASNDVQGSDTNVNDHSDSTAEVTEIRELFSTLRKLDPYREQYYTDVMQQLLSA